MTGEVPDVLPCLEEAAVFVAPLRIARGVQIKVLEAMACGVPVVMTSGLDVREKCEANGASAFMQKPFKPSELVTLVRRQLAPAH